MDPSCAHFSYVVHAIFMDYAFDKYVDIRVDTSFQVSFVGIACF